MFFSPSRRAFFMDRMGEDDIDISDERHDELIALINQGYRLEADDAGLPIAIAPPEVPTVEPTVDELFDAKLQLVNEDYEYFTSFIRGSYPPSETDTWPQQIDQARAYMKWKEAGFPEDSKPVIEFLEYLAQRRTDHGIPGGIDDLAQRVLANNQIFSPTMAEITARRHECEVKLRTALAYQNREMLEAVTWDFYIPPFGPQQPSK